MRDSQRDKDIKNRLLDSVGEGEGGMIREKHWNMYITICDTDHQSKFNAWNRALKAGALGQPWGREGGGSGVQDGGHMYIHWLICVNVWQKPLQYCKVISLQLK